MTYLGREFYSCSVCNSFCWVNEVPEGEQAVLQPNKSKYHDKSQQAQQHNSVKDVRAQYTKTSSPSQGGNNTIEFRNPQPYKPIQQQQIPMALEARLVGIEERQKQIASMIQQLLDRCGVGGDGEQPEEGGGVEEHDMNVDDNNKENKPPKH